MAFYCEYARGKRMRIGGADAISAERARQRAKEILGEAYQGADPAEALRRAKAQNFSEFVNLVYAPWAEANIKTAHATVARLKGNFADFGKKKLADITPWLVEKWRAARLKVGAKPATVNRDLDDLKSAIAKAVAWGQIEANPIASVKRSRVDMARAPAFCRTMKSGRYAPRWTPARHGYGPSVIRRMRGVTIEATNCYRIGA